MKREFGYIHREPQIILQRAGCGSRASGWSPPLYNSAIDHLESGPANRFWSNVLLSTEMNDQPTWGLHVEYSAVIVFLDRNYRYKSSLI